LLDKAIGLESKRKELGEQKRKFQSQGSLAAMHVPAIMRHKILSFAQEDKVEFFNKSSHSSVQLSSPSALINKLLVLQFSSRIARTMPQVHQ
jgi:hypothetical protein